jgi:hypothetical protein
VPAVYNVTATFETDAPVDLDSGSDGGSLPVAYNPPVIGAIGREIGLTQSNYLYWHFVAGGQSGIAYDSNPSGGGVHTASVIVEPGTPIVLFEVDPYGVAYQDNLGAIRMIRYGQVSPALMGGGAQSCTALAVDTSYNVYCRTSTTVLQWTYGSSYASPVVLYSGLPSGNDLHVESASGALYFSSSSAVLSLPISGADGSVATPTTIVSGSVGSTNLEANSTRFFWLDSSGYVRASSGKSSGATAYDTSVPPSTSFKYLAQDPNTTTHFWVASASAIYHAYYIGGTSQGATMPLRTGLSGIGGLTADSNYVYTSHADGTIRRVLASDL